jgi:hypothetical protein
MKISTTAWAIKIRGRSFYKMSTGGAVTLTTKKDAAAYAESITRRAGVMAEPIRVRVRIEEIK